MNLLRFAFFNLALLFTILAVAQGQSTTSAASVGDGGSSANLCAHSKSKDGSTSAGCSGDFSDPEGDSGAGAATGAASYSSLSVSGSATVAQVPNGQASVSIESSAATQIQDTLTIGNSVGRTCSSPAQWLLLPVAKGIQRFP
jgi:hypothetical protein